MSKKQIKFGGSDLSIQQIDSSDDTFVVEKAGRDRVYAGSCFVSGDDELEHAKTAFFSKVNHEFQMALTLMPGLLEELLANPQLPQRDQELLAITHRNSLRLFKLVNTLLDFSRIEADRFEAIYEPLELAGYTVELASVFRSVIEHVGLKFIIDCAPLSQEAWVDREMWEKIVLNLISNAFKFTLRGEISVRLREQNNQVVLTVSDTGTGIPEAELPCLFKRFYRGKQKQARTLDGTGIGLATIRELVKLHAGSIKVESVYGQGSTFTVSLPLGQSHLPAERIGLKCHLISATVGARPYVEEANRWLEEVSNGCESANDAIDRQLPLQKNLHLAPLAARVLIADDNTDMRDYLRRLVEQYFTVMTVPDGLSALEICRKEKPDLVLADVLMPGLDGLSLLKELRSSPDTHAIPVILLTARAGEQARDEGLAAGADDYIVKPFDARELLSRIEAHLKLAQLRRESMESLRESEERYRAIVENIQDAILVSEPADQGRIIAVNPRACALLGRTEQELIGLRRYDILDMTDSRLDSFLNDRACRGVTCKELTYKRKDGTLFPGEITSALFSDRNGKQRAVAIIRDISERKRVHDETERLRELAEKRAQEAEEGKRILETILKNIPVGLSVLKVASGERLYMSQYAEEQFGLSVQRTEPLSPAERLVLTKTGGQIISKENPIIRVFEKGESVSGMEWVLQRQDGVNATVLANFAAVKDELGNLTHVISAWQDITKIKELSSQLKEERNKLKFIIEKAQVGIMVLSKEGRVILTNPATDAIFGFKFPEDSSLSEQLGKAAFLDASGNLITSVQELPLYRSVIDGKIFIDYEMSVCTEDKQRNLLVNTAPLRDAAGKISGAIGTFKDITDLKAAEHVLRRDKYTLEQLVNERTSELLQTHTELQRAKRMADIGQLSATVAHEMRNPLAAIRVAAYNIRRKANNPLLEKHLETIDKKVLESDLIIQNLLSFTRLKSVSYEPVKIREMLKDCIATVSAKYTQWHVELLEHLECGRGDIIEVDFSQFQMLINNILDNAYQALPERTGTVTISACNKNNKVWEISIRDTGIGISGEELEKIFEPFYTTKSRGTGLGLAVCREIVDMHHGKIDVQSTPGKGTVFIIKLPVKRITI